MRHTGARSAAALAALITVSGSTVGIAPASARSARWPRPWTPPSHHAEERGDTALAVAFTSTPRDTALSGTREAMYSETLPVSRVRVGPRYPSMAREAGVGGLVITHVRVGTDGRVLEARVDPRHSVPMLERAALEAARQWVFEPATVCGHPVPVWVAVPFYFRLP